jgi:hypothetical protein
MMAHLERKMVPLYLTNQENEQLDLYAEILGLSRQKLLEGLILSSMEDLEVMEKIGFMVSAVRLADQLKMFKGLTTQDKNRIAGNKSNENE